MTLAISMNEQSKLFIVSDTKLSYEIERNTVDGIDLPQSALKTFFLSPQISITYAGTTQIAHDIIEDAAVHASNGEPLTAIASILQQYCEQMTEVEFLLAGITDKYQTYKITSSIFSIGNERVKWIGNPMAADAVLRGDELLPFDLASRFQGVLDDRLFDDVGGIVVVASANAHGFKFVPHMKLISPYYREQLEAEWRSVNWGSAATGGYAYTTITPVDVGNNGWGVHFFQGNCGYFFRADLRLGIYERLKWENTSLENAIVALQQEIGFCVEPCGYL